MADLSTGSPLASALMGINQGANQGINMAEKIQTMQNIPLQRKALEQHLEAGALDLATKKREAAALTAPWKMEDEELFKNATPQQQDIFKGYRNGLPTELQNTQWGKGKLLEKANSDVVLAKTIGEVSDSFVRKELMGNIAAYKKLQDTPNTPPEALDAAYKNVKASEAKLTATATIIDKGLGLVHLNQVTNDPQYQAALKNPTVSLALGFAKQGVIDAKEVTQLIVASVKDRQRYNAIQQYIEIHKDEIKTPEDFDRVFKKAHELTHPKTDGADKGFSLTPGQTRFDSSGRPIAHLEDREGKAKETQQFLVDFDAAQKDGRLNENTVEAYRPLAKRFGYDIQLKQVQGFWGEKPLYVLVPKEGVVGGAVKSPNTKKKIGKSGNEPVYDLGNGQWQIGD